MATLGSLIQRIQAEMVAPTLSEKRNVIMFKCWNVIRCICEREAMVKKYFNEIDALLEPVIKKAEEPQLTEFEDDLIELVISVVGFTGQIGPNLGRVVQNLKHYAKKFENKIAQIYLVYTTICKKATHIFSNKQVLDDMIEIGIQAMNFQSEAIERSLQQIFSIEGCMVLHLAIHVASVEQYMHGILDEAQWIAIFQASQKFILPDDPSKNSYFKARVYGIFFSAIYYEPMYAITYLVKTNLLAEFVRSVTSRSVYFMIEYDRRLLVLGLTSLIRQKLNEKQLDDITQKCIEICIYMLHIQRIEQSRVAGLYSSSKGNSESLRPKPEDEKLDLSLYDSIKDKLSKDAQENALAEEDDDHDEDFDEEDDDDGEEMEIYRAMATNRGKALISLKNYESPILKDDEFVYFIDTIKSLKVRAAHQTFIGPDNFSQYIGSFADIAQTALKLVVTCKKFTVPLTNKSDSKKEPEMVEVARKVVKVKRPAKPSSE